MHLVEGKVLKRIYSKVSYLIQGLVHKWPNCTECLSLFFPHHLLFSHIYTKHASLLKGLFHPDTRRDKESDVGKHLLGRRWKFTVLRTDVNQTPKCPPTHACPLMCLQSPFRTTVARSTSSGHFNFQSIAISGHFLRNVFLSLRTPSAQPLPLYLAAWTVLTSLHFLSHPHINTHTHTQKRKEKERKKERKKGKRKLHLKWDQVSFSSSLSKRLLLYLSAVQLCMEISDFFRFIANDQSANWLTSRAKSPGNCPLDTCMPSDECIFSLPFSVNQLAS